jgi:hypothetical protein
VGENAKGASSMPRRSDLRTCNPAKWNPIRHEIWRRSASRDQLRDVATASGAPDCRRNDATAERLLRHLQAENDQLRDRAVRLALEIQHLRLLA